MRRLALLAALVAAAAAAPPPAAARPSSPQALFRTLLLGDHGTSPAVRALLRDGGGFVDPHVAFSDLTGDGRPEAVVLVATGGAAGDVALYVFSTDHSPGGRLRAVERRQGLYRASASVRRGTLLVRTPIYGAGQGLCCPYRLIETRLGWSPRTRSFRVSGRRDLGPRHSGGSPAR